MTYSPPPNPPAGRPVRVAYFIASHANPDQVLRLARACLSGGGGSRVLIHHNYAVSDLPRAAVAAIDNADLLDGHVPVDWGGFSQCAMILRSLRWLLDHREFDWVVHLSGQDYPIRPLAEIEASLAATGHDGFVDARPADESGWLLGPQRYYYRYYRLPKFKGWTRVRGLIRRRADAARAAGGLPRLLIPQEPDRGFRVGVRPVFDTPFRDGFRCYTGSAWWTLSRRAVDRLVRRGETDARLVRHYRRAQFAATESFFPTLLCNDPDLQLVTNDDKRFVRWSRPETGRPDTLAEADFPALVASGDHFARKIDQQTAGRLLDLLDEHARRP
ncbi:MAG: hypothetical protein AVDCRST_MAG64-656 [uncultured Phycisphaerae bacterium]|uniref:Peptide O-xylosyltransferase n=1 Tax=uncultured Phycisphaerae bacterium TaxID=904963 RepID=A0A6J4NBC0_9BACT|nr:MAG: hypothetical protein AVDCRST_MAG64-656 [uncultured Phycisphaerae bacterium]